MRRVFAMGVAVLLLVGAQALAEDGQDEGCGGCGDSVVAPLPKVAPEGCGGGCGKACGEEGKAEPKKIERRVELKVLGAAKPAQGEARVLVRLGDDWASLPPEVKEKILEGLRGTVDEATMKQILKGLVEGDGEVGIAEGPVQVFGLGQAPGMRIFGRVVDEDDEGAEDDDGCCGKCRGMDDDEAGEDGCCGKCRGGDDDDEAEGCDGCAGGRGQPRFHVEMREFPRGFAGRGARGGPRMGMGPMPGMPGMPGPGMGMGNGTDREILEAVRALTREVQMLRQEMRAGHGGGTAGMPGAPAGPHLTFRGAEGGGGFIVVGPEGGEGPSVKMAPGAAVVPAPKADPALAAQVQHLKAELAEMKAKMGSLLERLEKLESAK